MKDDKTQIRSFTQHQKKYLVITLIVATMFVIVAILMRNGLNNSALLYMGIPIILSSLVAVFGQSKTLVGASLKALTICLLLSAIILREGFICIIMASPILYSVTALFAMLLEKLLNWRKSKLNKVLCSPLACLLILMSLEGTHPAFTIERTQTQSETQIINASINDIRTALATPVAFEAQWHWSTAIFPKPVKVEGQGLAFGDTRTVDYVYYKHIFFNAHKGSMVYRVRENGPDGVTFDIPKDTSYLSSYMKWHYSKVQWRAIDENRTEVTWTMSYDRILDPAWYFSPLQHFFVGKSMDYLLDDLAARALRQ